ncbi:hypothetical protein [Aestuariivirga litoralis]|uniref:hypothetical protein n=1 Tax=Aestuariivirga litoralis TaxID=2650924 RepID=UPI0018C4A0A4|nr:hypothetical protein [Aestuariivirga litoralis]MBG1231479.1 hypothetical protein [Aestuariivirga litoralis]
MLLNEMLALEAPAQLYESGIEAARMIDDLTAFESHVVIRDFNSANATPVGTRLDDRWFMLHNSRAPIATATAHADTDIQQLATVQQPDPCCDELGEPCAVLAAAVVATS